MKKNFYSLLLLFITFHAEAQLQKGLFSVGVSPEYYSPPTYNETNYFKKHSMNSTIDLRSQYFVIKNFAAEIGLTHYYDRNISSTYSSTSSATYRTDRKSVSNSFGLSLGVNHYYPIQKRLYFKTSLSYRHYQSSYKTEIISTNNPLQVYPGTSGKSNSLNLNANLVFFLSKKFTLDLNLGGLRHAFAKDGLNYTQISFKPSNWSIGVSYYPNAGKEKKKKRAKADSTSRLNDNVLKGRTYFFPNGTALDGGEVYVEPNLPFGVIILPIVDVGLGKGFSITVAPMFTPLDLESYLLFGNLKYAHKVSNKWSLSVNSILWSYVDYYGKKRAFDYGLFPSFAATRTTGKSELSFGVSIGLGKSNKGDYMANIGYMHKIGRRWAYTTDNVIYIDDDKDNSLFSTHAFKYHINKNFNFDFGVMVISRFSDGTVPIPVIKTSYHFPGKRNKPQIAS